VSAGSLSYRKHREAIEAGAPPDKYLRLLHYINGRHILEIGAAEGVLALLLADRDPRATVTALELCQARHEAALALQARWKALGRRVDGCRMVCGDIRELTELFEGVDCFVAIRTIYHLRDDANMVLDCAAAFNVARIVLGGNPNRANWRPSATPNPKKDALGAFNLYAGVKWMSAALAKHGYRIDHVVTEGDPIVTGSR
jgi:2-polyprenyl-3-methyl-5-hydroxy-6-metoxy-1,4-benzoquinol methylase